MKSKETRLYLSVAAITITAVLLWTGTRGTSRLPGASYSQFLQEVRSGKVDAVTIVGSNAIPARYRLKDGTTVRTVLPSDYRDALAAMQDGSVDIDIQESPWGSLRLLVNAIPFFVLLVVWFVLVNRLKGRPGIA
jgi:cell division protease FtsH